MNKQLRQQFPFFRQTNPIVYLDNAATTQKPQIVLDAMQVYWQQQNANVHRSSHSLSAQATEAFEDARRTMATFIGASSANEIVWTKGTTESINLLAQVLCEGHLQPGQCILLSHLEHHANIVPWQQVAKRLDMLIRVMPVDDNGVLLLNESLAMIDDSVAFVAIGHVSNALGNINPVQAIIAKAKQVGALSLIDGAQAVAHLAVDVQALGCDFYAFSGHKMYAPTGIGVLYGREALLEELPPYQTGGEMIEKVSFSGTTFQTLPFKFEAGTPNVAGVIGLAQATNFLSEHRNVIQSQEKSHYAYLLKKLREIDDIKLWGDLVNTAATQSFQLKNLNNQDLGILLNEQNVAMRVGHHCAMPLMERLGVQGTCRVSLACYNTEEEIDFVVAAIKQTLSSIAPTSVANASVNKISHTSDCVLAAPLAQKISKAKGWDSVYREIMLAGKQLTRIQEADKLPENEIHGCESQVWLVCRICGDSMHIMADSPSKIVRGLIAIMVEALQGKSMLEIVDFDILDYLAEIGLGKHLSDSRGNGLVAVVNSIRSFAKQNT